MDGGSGSGCGCCSCGCLGCLAPFIAIVLVIMMMFAMFAPMNRDFQHMTLLQLLVFLNLQLIFSHVDGVFSLFMGNEQVFGAHFDNFLPLSPRKSGIHTFLQKSHRLFR